VLHGFCTSIDSRFLDNWANASVAFRNTNDYMDSVYKTQDTFDDTSANAIAALHSPLSALRRTTSMSTPAAVHGRGKVATRFTTPLELFFLQTASNHRMRNCIFTTLTTRSIIAKGETLTFVDKHSTLDSIQQRLSQCNAFSRVFLNDARDILQQKNFGNLAIRIVADPENDGRRYNTPTVDEIAVVIVGDKSRNLLPDWSDKSFEIRPFSDSQIIRTNVHTHIANDDDDEYRPAPHIHVDQNSPAPFRF